MRLSFFVGSKCCCALCPFALRRVRSVLRGHARLVAAVAHADARMHAQPADEMCTHARTPWLRGHEWETSALGTHANRQVMQVVACMHVRERYADVAHSGRAAAWEEARRHKTSSGTRAQNPLQAGFTRTLAPLFIFSLPPSAPCVQRRAPFSCSSLPPARRRCGPVRCVRAFTSSHRIHKAPLTPSRLHAMPSRPAPGAPARRLAAAPAWTPLPKRRLHNRC